MKKLLLGLLGTVIILSFKPKMDANIKQPITSSDTICTLNGYSLAEARRMVAYCNTTKDKVPENTQIWFRREIIDSIYALLKLDRSNTTIGPPDGIRIYYARTPPSNEYPLHGNNRVVITSTYYSQPATTETGEIYLSHTDYFEHPKTAGLFKLKNINGVLTNDKDSTKGCLLYNKCHCDNMSSCSIDTNHDIARSKAEKMARHFHRALFRNGEINSKAEWFDTLMVHKLVDSMKAHNADGIRIYFARGTDNDYTKRKAKFIIVETHAVARLGKRDTIHKDFFDCNRPFANTYKKRKTIFSTLDLNFFTTYSLRHNISMVTLMSQIAAGGGLDNGELCPNHCQGVTLPQ
ncbi:MAG: hypothetical protein ACXVJD_12155 [Mucilaginibacter sp.]